MSAVDRVRAASQYHGEAHEWPFGQIAMELAQQVDSLTAALQKSVAALTVLANVEGAIGYDALQQAKAALMVQS